MARVDGKEKGDNMKVLVLLFFMSLAPAWAGNLFKFAFTRTDGTEWQCNKASHGPENPVLTATNQPPIGTNMPSYGGHTYRIDPDNQVLVIDETHSVVITMPDPTWHINPYHWGFAIDNTGVGWIISTESKDDNLEFLFTISLNNGNVTYFDYVGPAEGTPYRADGLVIIQFP